MTDHTPPEKLSEKFVRDFAARLERGETCMKHEAAALRCTTMGLRQQLVRYLGEQRTAALIRAGWSGTMSRSRVPVRSRAQQRTYVLPGAKLPDFAEGKPVYVILRGERVISVQLIGRAIRLASGHRVKRTMSDAILEGGSLLLPAEQLLDVMKAIQKAIRRGPRGSTAEPS